MDPAVAAAPGRPVSESGRYVAYAPLFRSPMNPIRMESS
jgi:hypothetical protein